MFRFFDCVWFVLEYIMYFHSMSSLNTPQISSLSLVSLLVRSILICPRIAALIRPLISSPCIFTLNQCVSCFNFVSQSGSSSPQSAISSAVWFCFSSSVFSLFRRSACPLTHFIANLFFHHLFSLHINVQMSLSTIFIHVIPFLCCMSGYRFTTASLSRCHFTLPCQFSSSLRYLIPANIPNASFLKDVCISTSKFVVCSLPYPLIPIGVIDPSMPCAYWAMCHPYVPNFV